MRQSWETMTSVSAGHIILTPTQPVGSGRTQRGSNPRPPHQESRALPTGLPRPWIRWNNSFLHKTVNSTWFEAPSRSIAAYFARSIWPTETDVMVSPLCLCVAVRKNYPTSVLGIVREIESLLKKTLRNHENEINSLVLETKSFISVAWKL